MVTDMVGQRVTVGRKVVFPSTTKGLSSGRVLHVDTLVVRVVEDETGRHLSRKPWNVTVYGEVWHGDATVRTIAA